MTAQASLTREFPKTMAALEPVFDFLSHCYGAFGAGRDVASIITLAVEEIFTNMVRHAPEGDKDVRIEVAREGNRLRVTMVDSDVESFDLTRAPDPDTTAPLETRKVGGLGIHLVRQMVDDLTYSSVGRQSTITFSKILET